MRSCSLRKLWTALSAFLLVLCLISPASAHAASAVQTADALQTAIESAAEGSTLSVGDLDFSSFEEPIVIAKSITLRSRKEQGAAIFSGAAFVIDGSAGKITVQFDNITFYSSGDAANIEESFWDEEPSLSPAMTFRGDVDARLNACVFRNYVGTAGANLYADYSDTDAVLNLQATDCSFLGNAVRDRGGAALLIGQKDKNNLVFTAENCVFTGNLSGNGETALGGGAVYAEAAVLKLTGCSFSANEASHQYLLPEPEEGTEGDGAAEGAETAEGAEEEAPAKEPDLTKGGAVYAVDSSLMMTDCAVTQCSASLGGGLALENTDFVFLNGIIANNRAGSSALPEDAEGMASGTGMGGGMFIRSDRAVIADIINSSFYGNSALNAYSGICFGGADGNGLPFTVRMMLCTYAENTVDTAYNMPQVDRSRFVPEDFMEEPEDEPEETEEPEETDEQEEAEPEKTEEEKAEEAAKEAEEAAKKAEEAAKRAEEAQKAAEEAYEKAVAEALAAMEWKEVPGNIWDAPFLEVQGSVVIDEIFSELGHNKVAFPRHEMPDAATRYSYFAAPEIARAEAYLPNVPSAVFTHVVQSEAFLKAYPLPDGMAEEILSPYFDKVLGTYSVGDNHGGSLSLQLMLDNAVWQTITADGMTPALPLPEKEGHSFDLWQTSDGKAYEEGKSFITGTQALTQQVNAVMHPNTYTLHFTSEGGTQDVQQVYGTPVTLPAAGEKKGYDFKSWFRSDGTPAKDGEVYTVTGDSSYTAQYTKQFPKTAVIALSAAIVLVALILIITRITENSRKAKAGREEADKQAEEAPGKENDKAGTAAPNAQEAPDEAALRAQEKAREQARKAQQKVAEKRAKEAAKQSAKEE